MKESKTKTVRRSALTLNPYNPKRHKDEQVHVQMKNIKKVGYLGGIVWNEASGNIIDGHRRVMALDLLNKYDGTPATDYDVRVEACTLDEKAEKEQMTYMAFANTRGEIDLVAKYAPEIDLKDLGFSEMDIKGIMSLADAEKDDGVGFAEPEAVEKFFDFVPSPTQVCKATEGMTPEEKKAHVKSVRSVQNDNIDSYNESASAYVTLSFPNMEAKVAFCEALGADSTANILDGISILNRL